MSNSKHNFSSQSNNASALKSAAVTGATGFIGGRLVEMLAENGTQVTCLIRSDQAGRRLHQAGAHIRKLDLTDTQAVRAVLQDTEIVFHLAYDWRNTEWNHKALRSVIDACSQTGCRLVYASSFVVYDIPKDGSVSEDSPPTPATGGYAHTKLALETELLSALRENRLVGAVVQPTIVYGPYSRPWTIDPADQLRNGTVILPETGQGVCNAVYVDDVVSAMLLAATRPEAHGHRYLISGTPPITWGEFYAGIARAIGAKPPQYWPSGKIQQAGSKAQKLMRLLTNPQHVIRKGASIGPSRKLTAASLRLLPSKMRQNVQHWLSLPMAEWRGHVHIPSPGHAGFLESRVVIDTRKAREQLGFQSRFMFEEAMKPTGEFLKRMYAQRDQTNSAAAE